VNSNPDVSSPSLSIELPAWQLGVVLLTPGLFVLNARMPWAQSLWVEGDKAYFYAFWSSIVLLYLVTSAVSFLFLKQAGAGLSDIGFRASSTATVKMIGAFVVLGLAAVWFRTVAGYENTDDLGFQVGWPASTPERLFWIPIYLAAGFFEEFVYRGVTISGLRGKGVPSWLAVGVASLAFSLIHGGGSWLISIITFGVGLLLGGIYLWRRNLAIVMVIHALADWTFIVTP